MSKLSRTVEKVADAAVAVGEYMADQVRPKPPQPRMTPSVRKAARKAAIALEVGRKRRGAQT